MFISLTRKNQKLITHLCSKIDLVAGANLPGVVPECGQDLPVCGRPCQAEGLRAQTEQD